VWAMWRSSLPEDTITLSRPEPDAFCFSATCRAKDRPVRAIVTVTFGRLPDLWKESWGRSYDMCADDWDRTREAVQKARPALMIRGVDMT
jgi:hypothetical protein